MPNLNIPADITEDQKKRIEAILGESKGNSKGWWDPKEGESYNVLDPDGIRFYSGHSQATFNECHARGTVFPTKEESEKADRWRVALQTIRKYIGTHFPFEPDWDDRSEYKYCVVVELHRLQVNGYTFTHVSPLNLYVATRAQAEELLRECRGEYEVLFNLK